LSGIKVFLSGIKVFLSGIKVFLSGIKVFLSGIKVFLSGIKETLISSTVSFQENLKYQFSCNSFLWESRCSMRTDGQS